MTEARTTPSHTPVASFSHSLESVNVLHISTRFSCNFSTLSSATTFRLGWTAVTGIDAIVTESVPAADLYWLDPVTNHPLYVAHTLGSLKSEWPPRHGDMNLGLTFSPSNIDRAMEGRKAPPDWNLPQTYLARLSFYPVRLPPATPTLPKFDNLTAVRNFSFYNTDRVPQSIRFVFERRGKDNLCLWASSTVLCRSCPYFETLMNSELAESQYTSDDKRREVLKQVKDGLKVAEEEIERDDSDSDSDIDVEEILDEDWTITFDPPSDCFYHRVIIRNAAYTTYRAVLMYLQTGYISFSPLTSSFTHLPPSARRQARLDFISAQNKLDPQIPLPASPKSVYKLAHYLSIPSLQSLAVQEISRQLSIENVFIELFDGLPAVYDDVRKVMVQFAVKHKKEVIETEGFRTVMERLRRNELTGSGAVVADLLPLFVG